MGKYYTARNKLTGKIDIFISKTEPTVETHGDRYWSVEGGYKNKNMAIGRAGELFHVNESKITFIDRRKKIYK